MEELKIYFNGEFIPISQPCIRVQNHALLYGDSCFEGIMAYNGRVFRLEEHINRLFDSAKSLMLEPPLDKQGTIDAVRMTLKENNLNNAYIRLLILRGDGDLGLDPLKCPTPDMFIIARPHVPEFEGMIKVVIVSTRRNPIDSLSPNIKSGNYLNNILAKIEANNAGADEGIMLNHDGTVSEGTGDSIFIVKKNVLISPPTITNLNGITRAAVIELAESLGIPVEIKNISSYDLYTADECFLTGTFVEIVSVSTIDNRIISKEVGSITKQIMDAFKIETATTGTLIN